MASIYITAIGTVHIPVHAAWFLQPLLWRAFLPRQEYWNSMSSNLGIVLNQHKEHLHYTVSRAMYPDSLKVIPLKETGLLWTPGNTKAKNCHDSSWLQGSPIAPHKSQNLSEFMGDISCCGRCLGLFLNLTPNVVRIRIISPTVRKSVKTFLPFALLRSEAATAEQRRAPWKGPSVPEEAKALKAGRRIAFPALPASGTSRTVLAAEGGNVPPAVSALRWGRHCLGAGCRIHGNGQFSR